MAKEYRKMIDSGVAKNQAELARIKGISRARVTQILNLMNLDKNDTEILETIRDPIDRKAIAEKN